MITVLLSTAGVLGALAVIGKAARWAYNLGRKIESSYDELMALPAFKAEVRHELNHNSGQSLKDHVVATRQMVENHISDPNAHKGN